MTVISPVDRLNQLLADKRLVSPSMRESARQVELMRGSGPTASEATPSFMDTLKDSIGAINEQQLKADEMAARFAAGQVEDIHDVMIAMEKASLSFQFMVEVRNKLLEGYQELMKMQV
jgi:flagellar hook-basal body complex protein FliE